MSREPTRTHGKVSNKVLGDELIIFAQQSALALSLLETTRARGGTAKKGALAESTSLSQNCCRVLRGGEKSLRPVRQEEIAAAGAPAPAAVAENSVGGDAAAVCYFRHRF